MGLAGLTAGLEGCMTHEPKRDATTVSGAGASAAAPAREVATFAELEAAQGQRVRVRGPVFHEKLGDGVEVDGRSILCPDLRFPDGVTTAALEGRLELWDAPVATTGARGEISQGVTEPTRRWVLRDCQAR